MVTLTEDVEASSSSPSTTYDHIYDVFISFRGLDTRLSFINHLYTALVNANLNTFLDDEEIPTGEFLKPELENAIKASRASIVVLSENYASSTWCLDELVLILEQKRNFDQLVIPVFYHVEPTHVRKQQSSFGKAMNKHELKLESETNMEEKRRLGEKMEVWKDALTEVSYLKGKDAKGRLETELIGEIVNDLYRRLGVPLATTTPPPLIGMEYYIDLITSWLKGGSSHTANVLTILGVGGIGKTSLANYVYELHRHEYRSCSFVGDISRRHAEKLNGLLDLQKQLYGDISKRNLTRVHDVFGYTSMIWKALAREKVFLVLDDIRSLEQLDALLGNKGLHPGSKIIITTKDASLTERCELFNSQVQPKHKNILVNGLNEFASLELLCFHAFKSRKPKEGYKEVSNKLVKYCEGHPLALQLLGRSLHKRGVAYWEECIQGLKKEPHFGIKNVLRMSFDSLPCKNDKDLFKYIACFFVRIDRDLTETILNACDINTRSGITNLIDRCLLSIGCNNELMMHQLVQQIGRDLVCQESPDKPWERSRLWCHKESFTVLEKNKGTENVLGLTLDMRMLEKEKLSGSLQLKTDGLSKIENLKLLQLNYVKLNGSYKNVSKELRWLCMHGFHHKSIPSEIPMENLVVLDMSHSNVQSFDMSCSISQRFMSTLKGLVGLSSKDKRLLGSLKILDLSFCKHLHSVGGFLELPILERLIVRNCINLVELCESIEQCVELIHLDMSFCYKLKKVPVSIGKLKKVKTLLLNGCNLCESQIEIWNESSLLISLSSSSAIMKAIPRDSKFLMSSLPSSLVILSLGNINLSNESFPRDFSCLSMLEELCLDNNPIVSMPSCVRRLPRLQILSMRYCEMLMLIERPPCTLRELSIMTYKKNYMISPREIKFDPAMSPLNLVVGCQSLLDQPTEPGGLLKIQSKLVILQITKYGFMTIILTTPNQVESV